MPLSALIIDDEQLARDELKYLLDSVGGVDVVAQGANGIEAVNLIEEHHPDLVFLDVQMPGQDGFAVIQRLMERKRAKTAKGWGSHKDAVHLPQFVFATAYDQYAVRAFDVNAADYLLKPFDRARVLEAVERVRARIAASGNHEAAGAPEAEIESQLDQLLRLSTVPKAPNTHTRPPSLSSRRKAVFFSSIRPRFVSHRLTRASFASSPAASRANPSAALSKSCSNCSIPRDSGGRIAASLSTSTRSAK